jgi:hypothetical protein
MIGKFALLKGRLLYLLSWMEEWEATAGFKNEILAIYKKILGTIYLRKKWQALKTKTPILRMGVYHVCT